MALARLEHKRPSLIDEEQKIQLLVKKIIPCQDLNPGPPTTQSAALPSGLSCKVHHSGIGDWGDKGEPLD